MQINNIEEFGQWISKGYYPLYQWRYFKINEGLRVSLQNLLFADSYFGRTNIVQSNQKYYMHCWQIHHEKQCEECFKPLHEYSATFISHILPRGAYPEYALDVRNHNLLCGRCHGVWESDKNTGMFIYSLNMLIIQAIKDNI